MRRMLVLMFVALLLSASLRAQTARPHIVFILADDLGWTDLSTGRTNGGNGSPYHRTPHLDALAAAGTSFTQAYSNGPNCAPTRAALWSGQWAARTGIYTVASGNRGKKKFRKLDAADNATVLAGSVVTLAEALKAAGYATAHFGKWHLGSQKDLASPTDQGFDHQVGGDHRGGIGRLSHFTDETGAMPIPGMSSNGKPRQFVADRLTDEALAWLGRAHAMPVFCCISHYSVHTPIQAPQEDIEATADPLPGSRHHHRKYAAMLKNLDDNVGRVMAWLSRTEDPRRPGHQMIENTLVVFTSDNGGLGGYRKAGIDGGQEITDQTPLRAGKGSLHEGGIRVPFVARWDGHIRRGRTDSTPLQLFDLYPTFVAIVGGALPAGQALDGADLSSRFSSAPRASEARPLFWHFPGYLEANGRKGTWRTTPAAAIRDGDLKAMFWFESRTWVLYDLAEDLNEARNLAADRPDELRRLARQLCDWLASTEAPMPRAKGGEPVALPSVPE